MLNLTGDERHTKQNKMTFSIHQISNHWKVQYHQVLERIWGMRTLKTAGRSVKLDTLESCLAFLCKIVYILHNSQIPLLVYAPEKVMDKSKRKYQQGCPMKHCLWYRELSNQHTFHREREVINNNIS